MDKCFDCVSIIGESGVWSLRDDWTHHAKSVVRVSLDAEAQKMVMTCIILEHNIFKIASDSTVMVLIHAVGVGSSYQFNLPSTEEKRQISIESKKYDSNESARDL